MEELQTTFNTDAIEELIENVEEVVENGNEN